MGDNNKIKKISLVSFYVLGSLYLLFLLLPLVLSPILNSYSVQIESALEEATGYKFKLEKLWVVTTPKLTAGVKAANVSLFTPDGQKFLELNNCRANLSLLPLLLRKIEADLLYCQNIDANLKVRQDGRLLIEEFLPQPDPDADPQDVTVSELPFGFKLSNTLPNIKVDNYNISFVDMSSDISYSLSGNNFRLTDFVLDKRFKLSACGFVTLNSLKQFNFNVKLFNKLMPELSLNDLVFNRENVNVESNDDFYFNILDFFKALNKSELSADLTVDLKTSGTFSKPLLDGLISIDKLSLLVDGKKLPESYFNISAKKHKLNLDVNLFTAAGENTKILGNFLTGKNWKISLDFNSNSSINNILRIINSIAKSFNYYDLESLSANGNIDADFSVVSDKKHVSSSGYFSIPNAELNYALYNILLKNIVANVDFNDDTINIKDSGFEIQGHPLKIFGSVKHNSDADLHVIADKILIKGLLAAVGQVQLLKENNFSSGTISLDASLVGKLSKPIPSVNLSLDNLVVHNIPTDSKLSIPEGKFIINTDGKKYSGDISIIDLNLKNQLFNISAPDTVIVLGDKNIDIKKASVFINNSKIDISGAIINYLSDNFKIDVNASGKLLYQDIKNNLIPKELRYMVSGNGEVPVVSSITGDKKVQDISFKLISSPNNYIAFFDVDSLKNKNTIINSNVRIVDDSAKFTNTGVYCESLSNPVALLEGAILDLSKSQRLNLRFSVPKTISMSIPGFKNSSMSLRGDIDITGTALNPYLKGLVTVPSINISDLDLKILNLVANLNGPVLQGNATVQSFKSAGIVAENIVTSFLLKNYNVFYLNNLAADAFNGKVNGDINYAISNGKVNIKLKGTGLNALKAIEGAAGLKNALSGTLNFDTNISTSGASETDMMKNLSGKLTFEIANGKFLNVGRFDSLLYAQNIVANSILKAAITSITNLPIIQNTAEFKSISGDMSFANGWANIANIKTSGPLMAYYITGKYNLINASTNLIILGRLDEKVVAVLGPLGDLSVDKLTSYIPKFGALTSVIIDSMTTDPKNENVENIPPLSDGSKNYKDFKVEFNGGIGSPSSVKSFKWLSKCDTSAIDIKGELNDAAESIKSTVDQAKQNLQDTKQQLLDAKEGLKNLFKF